MKASEARKQGSADFLEEFGLEVAPGEVKVGSRYPIFGMITKFLCDSPGAVMVELNFGIAAHLHLSDPQAIASLKERLFESGIFISTVVAKQPRVEVMCQTVILGRKPELNA